MLIELYYLKKVFEQKNYSKTEKKELQLFFLQNIIKSAYENNQFYREFYEKNKFHPRDLKSIKDLKKIPIVKKKDLIANRSKFLVKKDLSKYKIISTSGTTNTPLDIYMNDETTYYNNAIFIRTLLEQGYNPFNKLGFYWYRKEKNSFFNKFKISRKVIIKHYYSPKKQYKIISENKLKFLYYFPFKLFELCSYFQEEELKKLKIKRIFTVGEILTSKMKKLFESNFGCVVTDNYGLTEFNIVAYQKPNKNYYQINYDNNYVEAIDNEKRFLKKNIKKAIITSFSNFFMPLIRLDTDDYIELNEKTNKIKRIFGKENNFLRIGNNKTVHISALVDCLLTYNNYINLFKFEFKKKHLKTIISKKEIYNKHIENKIISDLRKITGALIKHKLIYTTKISFEKRGKLTVIKQ